MTTRPVDVVFPNAQQCEHDSSKAVVYCAFSNAKMIRNGHCRHPRVAAPIHEDSELVMGVLSWWAWLCVARQAHKQAGHKLASKDDDLVVSTSRGQPNDPQRVAS